MHVSMVTRFQLGAPIKTTNAHFWPILSGNSLQNAHVLLCTRRFFIKFSPNLDSKLGVIGRFTFNGATVVFSSTS